MTKRTRKITRFKGGSSQSNKKTLREEAMEKVELLAKSTAMAGLRNRYFVKEEQCKFDINRPNDYRGNKTQDNVRTKLNKCKLFNKDPKLKKFMKEKLIDSCKTYHDVTAISDEGYDDDDDGDGKEKSQK